MPAEQECPLCGHDVSHSMCGHLVASINQDMDRPDERAIPRFGWIGVEGWTDARDDMCDAFDEFFVALTAVCAHALRCGLTLNQVEQMCDASLPDPERHALQRAFETAKDLIEQMRAEDGGTDHDSALASVDVADERDCASLLFEDLYNAVVSSPLKQGFEILSGPGLTWTGTNYFAPQAEASVSQISARLRHHAGGFRRVVEQMRRRK